MQRHIELLEQARAHYAADMLKKGSFSYDDGSGFHGCSVGCHLAHIMPHLTAEEISNLGNKHKIVAHYYEYPEWLALLQDMIFENLSNIDSAKWHLQLAEAIASRKGSIDWKETLQRIHDSVQRVSYRASDPAADAVKAVLHLLKQAREGNVTDDDVRHSPRFATRSAVRFAARLSARLSSRITARLSAEATTFENIRDAVLLAIYQPC